jgi:hypothetical protein
MKYNAFNDKTSGNMYIIKFSIKLLGKHWLYLTQLHVKYKLSIA